MAHEDPCSAKHTALMASARDWSSSLFFAALLNGNGLEAGRRYGCMSVTRKPRALAEGCSWGFLSQMVFQGSSEGVISAEVPCLVGVLLPWTTAAPAMETASGCAAGGVAGRSAPLVRAVTYWDGRGISLNNPGGIFNAFINSGFSLSQYTAMPQWDPGRCFVWLLTSKQQRSCLKICTLYKWKTQARGNTVASPETCFKPVIKIPGFPALLLCFNH